MKMFATIFCIFLMIFGCAKKKPIIAPQEIVPPQEWHLFWSDEFDGEKIDQAKWSFEIGLKRNSEAQYYTDRLENVEVKAGYLLLQARREDHLNANYTSGSITTRNIQSFRYGRIEVRAKLPKGKGVWPAFWTTGIYFSWPKGGEIDIFEYIGRTPSKIHASIHYEGRDGKHKRETKSTKVNGDEFHIYAIEWNATDINFYYDDDLYFEYMVDKATGQGSYNPFRSPHILRINLALGGTWGGEIDDSILPQQYIVDYVRVYKRATKNVAVVVPMLWLLLLK